MGEEQHMGVGIIIARGFLSIWAYSLWSLSTRTSYLPKWSLWMMYICFLRCFLFIYLFFLLFLNNKKRNEPKPCCFNIYIYKFLTRNWSYLKLCGEDKPHLSA